VWLPFLDNRGGTFYRLRPILTKPALISLHSDPWQLSARPLGIQVSGGVRDLRRINWLAKEKPYDRQLNFRRRAEEYAVQPTGWTETRSCSRRGAKRPKTRTTSRCGAKRPKARTTSRRGANRPQTRTTSRRGANRPKTRTETRSCSRCSADGQAKALAGSQTDEVCGNESEVRCAGGIPFP
jgi:hypothetical protein